ncbi:MAG: ECF transporter S component [Clostridiales Family XIII bacterium]|nr:ECF transporter S component [Clostridiales Family XIII bacterium]
MNTEKLILTGLLTALIAVTTGVIAIPVPFTNGYVHPGDSMIFMAVLILGRRRGALAAGLGSAIADSLLGYFIWAPFTLVIKAGMAFVAGSIIEKCIEKCAEKRRNLVASCAFVVALWFAFNAAVGGIVLYAANADATSFAAALGADAGAQPLSSVVTAIETRLMAAALLIPAALLLIAVTLRRKENISVPLGHIVGMTGGGLFMVFGYYIAGGLIYGNFVAAAFSIPANIAQFAGGFLIASLLSAALQNTFAKRYFIYGAKKAEAGKAL